MSKLYYSYDDIHNIIKNSVNSIEKYNPDYILAIGGGGLIPARIIRGFIKKPIYVISVESYNDFNQNDEIKVLQWTDKDFKDKKVLLVDEVDDTRKTLKFCVEKLIRKNNVNKLCIYVVHNKNKEKCTKLENTDYISGENIKDEWVIYPWE